jgi:hypothetical protein
MRGIFTTFKPIAQFFFPDLCHNFDKGVTLKIFTSFLKNVNKMPLFWAIWTWCLGTVNMAALFFLDHLEGKIVLATMMIAATLMLTIHKKFGFVRLMGLAHLPWIPMLIWLYTRMDTIKLIDGLYKWILLLFVFDGMSLILDTVDVVKYFLGQKKPTV